MRTRREVSTYSTEPMPEELDFFALTRYVSALRLLIAACEDILADGTTQILAGQDLPARLEEAKRELNELTEKYKPIIQAVEIGAAVSQRGREES